MRPIPKEAVDLVARWEGCELTAYRDIVGVLTIGYGSTGDHVVEGLKITPAQARNLLKDDLKIAAARIYARIADVADELSEHQYAALLSFVFNLGYDPKWTIWKLLRAREFDAVPAQFLRFVNAGGKKVQGLVNRRSSEVVMWNTADAEAEDLPSSSTRSMPTPPTPVPEKPIVQSKSFMTTAASAGLTTVTAGTVAVSEVSKALAPYSEASPIIGKVAVALATLAAFLAVAAVVFVWLKRRSTRR